MTYEQLLDPRNTHFDQYGSEVYDENLLIENLDNKDETEDSLQQIQERVVYSEQDGDIDDREQQRLDLINSRDYMRDNDRQNHWWL